MDKEQEIIMHFDYVEGCAWIEVEDYLPVLKTIFRQRLIWWNLLTYASWSRPQV